MTTNDPGAFDRAASNIAARTRGTQDPDVFGPLGKPPDHTFSEVEEWQVDYQQTTGNTP